MDTPHLASHSDGICPYYLQGICAFGSKCFNKHTPVVISPVARDLNQKSAKRPVIEEKTVLHIPCDNQENTLDKLPADVLRVIAGC
jgi:hypothetical protein